MLRFVKLILFVAMLLGLSGCVSKSPNYPEAWPNLKHHTDIESELVGSFACPVAI